MMANQGSSTSTNSSNGSNTQQQTGNVAQTTSNTSNNNNNNNSQTSSILITSMPSLTATASALAAASTSSLASNTDGKTSTNSSALIEMIMCKLVAPFHVINDPRLLECGSSACFDCIMTLKDNERNLKCPYCNTMHKIPLDSNKLISNKNLQTFLKINFADLNQNFSKQLEDSMFALERKNFIFVLFCFILLHSLD